MQRTWLKIQKRKTQLHKLRQCLHNERLPCKIKIHCLITVSMSVSEWYVPWWCVLQWASDHTNEAAHHQHRHQHTIRHLLDTQLSTSTAVKDLNQNDQLCVPVKQDVLPSALWHCCLGGRKGIRPVKNTGFGGGGHWLVRMECRPAGWLVCLPLLIFPCTIKSRSSLLAPAQPGGPGKRAIKRL